MTPDNELPKPDASPFLSYDPDEDATAPVTPAPGARANGTGPDSLEPSFREPAADAGAESGTRSDPGATEASATPVMAEAPAPTTRPFYPPPPVITREDRPTPRAAPAAPTPAATTAALVPNDLHNDLPQEGIDDLAPSEHTPVSAAGAVAATESMRREEPAAEPQHPQRPDAPGRPGPKRGAASVSMTKQKRAQLAGGLVLIVALVVVLVLVLL